jgi:hypothetical protein
MRRICMTAMACTGLALAMPGVASAHHHARHADARRARAHHHRGHHTRTVTFAANSKTTTTTDPTTTKTEPMPPSAEGAGTVTSFEGGVLKITLADGTVVSGKVAERTEISCGLAAEDGEPGDDDGGQDRGEDHGGGDGGDHHGGGDSGSSGGSGSSQGDDEHGGMPAPSEVPVCGTSALIAGAKVHEAELTISSAGAIWEKVELSA